MSLVYNKVGLLFVWSGLCFGPIQSKIIFLQQRLI